MPTASLNGQKRSPKANDNDSINDSITQKNSNYNTVVIRSCNPMPMHFLKGDFHVTEYQTDRLESDTKGKGPL